jgi:hypothetical protein
MKKYNESKKNKYELIRKKLFDASPKTVLIPLADDAIKIDRRTKRGKRQTSTDVIPSYQTRKRELGQGTKNNYISKANTIHRIFTDEELTPELRTELIKLVNDKPIDENFIIDNMKYLINKTPTIETLRSNNYNDNTFKSYLNVLVVITSHLPSLRDNYQILTKLSIKINKAVQDVRDENKLHECEKDKIIDLNRNIILKHLNLLTNIKDRLIFALYTLQPARRLDWRLTVLTTKTDEKKLDNENKII